MTDHSYMQEGDAIEGLRVVCEFKRIGKVNLISASHTHRGSRVTLNDAYCVITKPLKF